MPKENHATPELTPIEVKLLEAARSGQSVLLYGKDSIGRKELILKIHKQAICLDETKRLTYTKELLEKVDQGLIENTISRKSKAYYVNCGTMNGNEIYETIKNIYTGILPSNVEISDAFTTNPLPELSLENLRKLYFLDNTYCDSQTNQDFLNSAGIAKSTDGKWLVIYTYDIDKLPQYFREQFQEISLESTPEMQGNGQRLPHMVNTFPMPPGANINDIKMCLLDDENIRIDVKEESKTFHYAQMGLSAKTNNRPLAAWDALQDYAEYNGNLHKVDNARQKRSERLNKLLKSFFQTDKDLIVSNQTLFKISKRKASSKKPVHIQLTECPVCKKNHRHYCYVCEDTTNHCQECHDGIYTEAHNKLN
ncbi:MAG: hypothetical protein L3J17_13435 [Candidatus Jettenia sp.]|nr:MAG: hypothetical protein L3J17_13435 [Candidatus Jettenia sp.]